jgi:hypothetical protein
VRRLLGRIDGDALDRAVGRWLADRRAGGALRLAGKSSIAAGLRRNARDASRPLALLGLT